ncbi:MAG: recombination-associated protein RdgC, partial [Gammaproteobacteria bacterium]
MLFKQIQVFQLNQVVTNLEEKLNAFAFSECLPSLPSTNGWVPPLEDEANPLLTRTIDGNIIFSLQIEEKLLPATVIRQQLQEKINHIETMEARKVRQKEKLQLKDELTHTLLPRAFSKFTKIYAYID